MRTTRGRRGGFRGGGRRGGHRTSPSSDRSRSYHRDRSNPRDLPPPRYADGYFTPPRSSGATALIDDGNSRPTRSSVAAFRGGSSCLSGRYSGCLHIHGTFQVVPCDSTRSVVIVDQQRRDIVHAMGPQQPINTMPNSTAAQASINSVRNVTVPQLGPSNDIVSLHDVF